MTTEISYQCEIKQLETAVRNYCEQRDKLKCEVTALRAQLDQAHADGAVMRGALELACGQVPENMSLTSFRFHRADAMLKALSTNAGRDLLARYREVVELLECCQMALGGHFSHDDGEDGCLKCIADNGLRCKIDTLLATVKGVA